MSDDLDLGVLAESFAEFLGDEWPRERALAYASSGAAYAEDLWTGMAGLGWTALTAPEEFGGLGMGASAVAALHMALGAAVVPAPMLGTTLATELLVLAGSEFQKAAWLPGLAEGSIRAAVSFPTANAIEANGDGLDASCPNLLDAASASMLFLRATRNGKSGWLVVPADAAGVSIDRDSLTDTTRTLGTVTLSGLRIEDGQFIASSSGVDDALLRLAGVALAADAIGGGEAVLAATIDYMKIREQFGVVIGSFQALKHRVADHQAALVAARHLVEHSAGLADTDPQALLYALSSKQHATRVTAEIARDCIQLHGGVGFTAEYVPHLYLKRGKLNEALVGNRATLLDRIADMLEAA